MRAGSRTSAGLPLALGTLTIGLLGCGSQSARSDKPGRAAAIRRPSPTLRSARSNPTVTVPAAGELPTAMKDPAFVALDDSRLALLGGLDAGDASTAPVSTCRVDSGSGPAALHRGSRAGARALRRARRRSRGRVYLSKNARLRPDAYARCTHDSRSGRLCATASIPIACGAPNWPCERS
jgi:hypothetical protein